MTRRVVFLALRDHEGRDHRRQARERGVFLINASGLVIEAALETRLARGDRFTHPDLGPVAVTGVEIFTIGKSVVAA